MGEQPSPTAHDALIDAFCGLYARLPLEKVTVKAISAEAGVSRVTFYNHFQDPYHLLDVLEDELIDTVVTHAVQVFEEGFEPRMFLKVFMEMYERNGPMMRLMFLGSHADAFSNKAKDAFIEVMGRYLPMVEEDPVSRYAIEYHVAGIMALFRRWLKEEDIESSDMALIVHELVTRGFMSTLYDGAAMQRPQERASSSNG